MLKELTVIVAVLKQLVSVDTGFAASKWIPLLFHLVGVVEHTNLANSVAARGFHLLSVVFLSTYCSPLKALPETSLQ